MKAKSHYLYATRMKSRMYSKNSKSLMPRFTLQATHIHVYMILVILAAQCMSTVIDLWFQRVVIFRENYLWFLFWASCILHTLFKIGFIFNLTTISTSLKLSLAIKFSTKVASMKIVPSRASGWHTCAPCHPAFLPVLPPRCSLQFSCTLSVERLL